MTANRTKGHGLVLGLLGCGLGLMLAAALSYFAHSPGLVQHVEPAPAETRQAVTDAPTGEQQGAPSVNDAIMDMMRRLQESPNDLDALTSLAQHFLHIQDFEKAETFALRAVLSAPSDPMPLHLLGIVQFNMGRHAEAAASLEKSLGLKFDPYASYSLGILYAFYMNDAQKGLSWLQKALETPNIPPDLGHAIQEDITKIKQGQTALPQQN